MDKNMENNFSPCDQVRHVEQTLITETGEPWSPRNANKKRYGADPLLGENPMFNPIMQYEQTYMYYRCLCQQMDYKIKCKEYEKLCGNSRNERRVE